MRKRVTFVDHLKNENLFRNGSGHVLMRSTDSKRCADDLGRLPSLQIRERYKGTRLNVPAVSQHMKTIHTPKSLMSAPYLQHPALTAGQRRYLCSIANIYSTEHMRRQMKHHYLNVLHACLQSGQHEACRRKYGDQQHREIKTLTKDAEKDATRTSKPQRKNNNRANSGITLPKIVNR